MLLSNVLNAVKLDRSRHAAPQVFDKLRELILDIELTPGTLLSRSDLAEAFGISQTPIRDALLRLGEEGLVDIYPQHATVVSKINIANAKQAQFLRRSIDLEVVRELAQHRDPVLWERLQSQIFLQERALQAGNFDALVKEDREFHRYMHVAAKTESLWYLQQQWGGHLDRLRRLHVPEVGKGARIISEHQAILDAIREQSPDKAQQRLREHLSGTLSHLEAICQAYPDYVTE